MNKHHTSISRSRRNHIDSAISSDCSQQADEPECENHLHRNNHNSGLVQHDELPKSTGDIGLRKRRTLIPSNHHHYRSSSSIYLNNNLLILIRLMILLFIGLTFYYIFAYIYFKPKKNGWERAWYAMTDWLVGE
jgi:hypothetical protein